MNRSMGAVFLISLEQDGISVSRLWSHTLLYKGCVIQRMRMNSRRNTHGIRNASTMHVYTDMYVYNIVLDIAFRLEQQSTKSIWDCWGEW